MYKLMAFMSAKPGMSDADFRDYYERIHVALINRLLPPMRGYRRNFVNRSDPVDRNRDMIDFDVITELEFDDYESFAIWNDAFNDPVRLEQILDDEDKFFDQPRCR